jgi:hypothetical protein
MLLLFIKKSGWIGDNLVATYWKKNQILQFAKEAQPFCFLNAYLVGKMICAPAAVAEHTIK